MDNHSPLPWRVGTKVPHNIYDADGNCVAHTHSDEDAAFIVEKVNNGLH